MCNPTVGLFIRMSAAAGGGLSALSWLAVLQWAGHVLPTVWYINNRGWSLPDTLRLRAAGPVWIAVSFGSNKFQLISHIAATGRRMTKPSGISSCFAHRARRLQVQCSGQSSRRPWPQSQASRLGICSRRVKPHKLSKATTFIQRSFDLCASSCDVDLGHVISGQDRAGWNCWSAERCRAVGSASVCSGSESRRLADLGVRLILPLLQSHTLPSYRILFSCRGASFSGLPPLCCL